MHSYAGFPLVGLPVVLNCVIAVWQTLHSESVITGEGEEERFPIKFSLTSPSLVDVVLSHKVYLTVTGQNNCDN